MRKLTPAQKRHQRLMVGVLVALIIAVLALMHSFSLAARNPLTGHGSTAVETVQPVSAPVSSSSSSVSSASVTVLTEQSSSAPAVLKRAAATLTKAIPAPRTMDTKTARSFFSIFGRPKEGQVLMYTNGRLGWRDLAYDTVLQNLSEGSVNISGYGRKPYKYPIDASSVLHSAAGGQASPERHYGGGGGATTTATTSTVNNYYTTNTTTGGSGSLATFIGTTPVTSYTGLFSSGAKTGYDAGNAICAAAYTGSHFCRTDEILETIASKDISTLFSGVPDAWIAEGPPGYTADSNDCRGWTSANLAHLGPWWDFATSGGGIGYLTNCSTTKPLACCKAQ